MIRLTVFLCALLFSWAARADYVDYQFEMRCDKAKNRVEIRLYAVSNKLVFSYAPKDCTLPGGKTVRAKLGLGPVFPYGHHGADPEKWISIWVDKALIVSKANFDCYDSCSLRAVVSTRGVELCWTQLSEPGQPRNGKEKCEKVSGDGTPPERDAIEYPAPGEPVRPAAGSFATAYAKDPAFCRGFGLKIPSGGETMQFDVGWIVLPPGAQKVQAARSISSAGALQYKRYDFDINNDGQVDIVVGLESYTSGRDADVYFALNELSAVKINSLARDPDSAIYFARVADRFIPHAWVAGAERKLASDGEDEAALILQNAEAPWWNPRDVPTFSLHGTHLLPFRYKGATYFVTQTIRTGWFTVMKPTPDYKATEICAFRVVEPKY